MEVIRLYIFEFFKSKELTKAFLGCLVFSLLFIILNYSGVNFQTQLKTLPMGLRFIGNFLFYSLPWISGLFITRFFNPDLKIQHSRLLFLTIFFGIALYSLRVSDQSQNDWFVRINQSYFYFYQIAVASYIKNILIIIIGVFVWWKWFDRKNQPFYGFNSKDFYLKPYLTILIIMVPFILIASFNEGFRDMYPRVGPYLLYTNHNLWYAFIYEFFYSLDFVSIEIFFRGFLILGLVRFIGIQAILPAACFYVFIHFGKPVGECVSSFFGGTLLGIITYRSKSIYGGMIAHIGIAILMEITGSYSKIMFP